MPGTAAGRVAGTPVLAPVLVVAVVLGFLIASRLVVYHGNATGFVLFGRTTSGSPIPPAGAPINSPAGYDGQFYWIQANDPLLLRGSTLADLHATAPGYHLQRLAYPRWPSPSPPVSAARCHGRLLAVNVLAVLGHHRRRSPPTRAAAAGRRGGRSRSGLTPGLLMPTLRDLSDPLATASMLAGCWPGSAAGRGGPPACWPLPSSPASRWSLAVGGDRRRRGLASLVAGPARPRAR